LFIFDIKCIVPFFTGEGIAGVILYLVPLAIAVIVTVKYKNRTKFSIISGLILAFLEMIDYIAGIIGSMGSNAGATAWILARVAAIACLYYAFKWQRNKSSALSASATSSFKTEEKT
jgi:hypothetical protein